jgi:hypothetical protein
MATGLMATSPDTGPGKLENRMLRTICSRLIFALPLAALLATPGRPQG